MVHSSIVLDVRARAADVYIALVSPVVSYEVLHSRSQMRSAIVGQPDAAIVHELLLCHEWKYTELVSAALVAGELEKEVEPRAYVVIDQHR